jgi:hypothetical protein
VLCTQPRDGVDDDVHLMLSRALRFPSNLPHLEEAAGREDGSPRGQKKGTRRDDLDPGGLFVAANDFEKWAPRPVHLCDNLVRARWDLDGRRCAMRDQEHDASVNLNLELAKSPHIPRRVTWSMATCRA